jgi:hypothetical protein
VVDIIALSLTSLSAQPASMTAVTELTDDEVLTQAGLQMTPGQDRQLSNVERSEMMALMQVYLEALLRKAQALHEAVRRGLREPLEP